MHILSCPLYERPFHNYGTWSGTYGFEVEDDSKCGSNYHMVKLVNVLLTFSHSAKKAGNVIC